MKFFSIGIIAVVALAVIASFFLIGSPAKERERQLDMFRSNHLNDIRNQVNYYWFTHDKQLPASLDALTPTSVAYYSSWFLPVDPGTHTPYEYEVIGEKQFRLCATFSAERHTPQDYYPKPVTLEYRPVQPDFMIHPKGRHCFDVHVDEKQFEPHTPVPSIPLAPTSSVSTSS